MLKKTITIAILLLLSTISLIAVEEQKMTQIDIAIKYYQALYSKKYDIVRSIASSNMIFEDPSAPHEFGIPARLNKLDSFLTFMKSNLQGKVKISFTDKYVSNNRVVLFVSIKGTIPASSVGMGRQGMVEYASQGVSIIYIVNGKIKRHTDYFDYPALTNSFKKID